jgi:hypothetical protein
LLDLELDLALHDPDPAAITAAKNAEVVVAVVGITQPSGR